MKQGTRRLFIARLPFEATAEDLLDHFTQFGEITDVYCPKDPNNPPNNKGFGFVSFQSVLSSQQAFGSGPHLINGREVVIDFALERPTEENQNNGSQDYFSTPNHNNNLKVFHNFSTNQISPNSDAFGNEQFKLDPGRQIGHYHDFNEYTKTKFNTYTDFGKTNNNNFTSSSHNQFISGSNKKEKLKFQFHLTSVKNESLTALMTFSDNNDTKNNQFEMPQGSNIKSYSDLSNIFPTNQPIPIDVYPTIIPKPVEDSINSKQSPVSLEFNIHLPYELVSELTAPYNIDKYVPCQFHFVTDSTTIEETSEFSEGTPSSFSKRTKLQHLTGRNYDHFYDKRGPYQLNAPMQLPSSQPIRIMSSSASMQPPSNHIRNTKRPPGGNEWIKRGHRIYVGQLNPKTSSDDLKQYFQPFGEVVDAYIPKDFQNGISRGFGFVTFLDPQVAEDLINNSANRHDEINGTRINISKARPS